MYYEESGGFPTNCTPKHWHNEPTMHIHTLFLSLALCLAAVSTSAFAELPKDARIFSSSKHYGGSDGLREGKMVILGRHVPELPKDARIFSSSGRYGNSGGLREEKTVTVSRLWKQVTRQNQSNIRNLSNASVSCSTSLKRTSDFSPRH